MELVFTLGKLEIVLNLGILTGAVSGILLKALIVGLLTSVCAAVLGVPLVLKRYSMIGDGLSHMGFCALAIAAALGVPENKETLVTMPLIVAAAVVLLLLSEKGKLKGDAAIAMLSTGAVGLGYIIYRFAGGGTGDVCSSLFGSSITALENSDVWFSCILAVGVIGVFVLLYHQIFSVTFDPAFAKASGAPVTLLSLLIALLTAVTIVIGMKMIGSIMISAFIVFPALAAMRLCKHFRSTILLSAGLSAGSFVLGLFFAAVTGISFGGGERIDLPIGPCVVAFNILALLVCILISKVRGRRKNSKVHAENAAA